MGRGTLSVDSQAGMDADIVVFDPAIMQDRATYEQPNQTSIGMRYVSSTVYL
jgi:N-acyl-D-aspartate/D-glutamate deacylase